MSAAPATVLVIDDEELVRQLVRRMLEPEVCQVLEAPDGETGLRLIERRPDTIDVVLTDLLMPGIDGYDVVEVLAAHRPELPVACMSGFANHPSVRRRILVPYIPKPFDVEALRGALEPLIARSQPLRGASPADRRPAGSERATGLRRPRQASEVSAEAVDLVAAAHELRRRRAGAPPER